MPPRKSWIVTRNPSNPPGSWHVQARTSDQLCSFAVVVAPACPIFRGKTPNGLDVFTLTVGTGQATMNVVGRIAYEGTWK